MSKLTRRNNTPTENNFSHVFISRICCFGLDMDASGKDRRRNFPGRDPAHLGSDGSAREDRSEPANGHPLPRDVGKWCWCCSLRRCLVVYHVPGCEIPLSALTPIAAL